MTGTVSSFCIVADDLSGAADCAAAFAPVSGPVPVLLGAGPLDAYCMAVDTDTRSMERAAAVAATARVFGQLARSDPAHGLTYKKIDSTLRGHVGAELQAALAAAPRFAGAVVAPAFAEQGRTFAGGRLCLHGRPVEGPAGDLMGLLAAAGLRPALLGYPRAEPAQVLRSIEQAMARGARAVVVDAADAQDLARLAGALGSPEGAQLLVAGSAGLARALARHVRPPSAQGARARAALPGSGPVLTLVGSFSDASAAQVAQVEAAGDARVIRLDASQWQGDLHASLRHEAIEAARAGLAGGGNLLFAIGGVVAQPFSRALVQAMARAAAPLLRHAGTCILTGGDTARALFDELRVDRIAVAGEFEPGISLARAASDDPPAFVLKAGGFGDAQALQRIIRYFGAPRPQPVRREAGPS